MDGAKPQSALKGIRILDFSWVLAGPYATRLLADFGAEVIKVQPLLPEAVDTFSRGYYNTWNRNKSGLSLDLSKPQGLEIARRLIKISDIVVENFSPRVLGNWGLDYLEMRKLRADIILLSLSMMGHSGPWRDYSGFGPAIQAFTGMTYLTAYSDKNPIGLGYAYSDHIAGLYGALALQGALEYREKSGQGQYIDLSQTETLLSLMADPMIQHSRDGKVIAPQGNNSDLTAPQGVYPCRGEDRWCAISIDSEEEWRRFRIILGSPTWAENERFELAVDRIRNSDTLNEQIVRWTRQHCAEELADILQSAGIAAEIVKSSSDLAADPHLIEQGFFVHLEHPEMGDTVSDASPIRLSDAPAEYRRAAPMKGQDNDYVLGELLGMKEDEIKKLKQDEVI
jgi:benzylsuccinate CoA-transferase BbsF subunit